jgi:hypothetical protein
MLDGVAVTYRMGRLALNYYAAIYPASRAVYAEQARWFNQQHIRRLLDRSVRRTIGHEAWNARSRWVVENMPRAIRRQYDTSKGYIVYDEQPIDSFQPLSRVRP